MRKLSIAKVKKIILLYLHMDNGYGPLLWLENLTLDFV